MAASTSPRSKPKAARGAAKSTRKRSKKPGSNTARRSKERRAKADNANAAPESGSYSMDDPAAFGRNMAHIAVKSQKLIAGFLSRQAAANGDAVDPLNIGAAFYNLFKQMAADPAKIVEAQIGLWKDHLELWQRTARRVVGETVEPLARPTSGDKRFRHPEWDENQIFDYIKQSYLLTSSWLMRTVSGVKGLDPKDQARADFYAKQFVDAAEARWSLPSLQSCLYSY